MADKISQLEERIKELEAELADRDRDLTTFRTELTKANIQLEIISKAIVSNQLFY